MFFHKKISSDVLLLVLLVVRLRLDSDINLLNEHSIREPESREVLLGSSFAYTQITFHSPYLHPKSIDYSEYEDAALLFNQLHYLNSVQRPFSVTYYASSPHVYNTAPSNTDAGSEATGEENNTGDSSLSMVAEETLDEAESAAPTRNQELSPEDMDLIEILWKQDIDLGVSREAYDIRSSVETEKLKDSKESLQVLFAPGSEKPCEENKCTANISDGLNYPVDSETGEFELDDLPVSTEVGEILSNVNFSTFDLPFYEDDDLFTLDLMSHIDELTENDPSSESLHSQSEDIFPNTSETWPVSDTMLPMLALENSPQTPFAPLPPMLESSFHNANSVLSLNQPNEPFNNAFQISSLEVNAANEAFYHPPITLGFSSMDCIFSESSITFANDTDPVPTSSFNTTYDPDLKEVLYSNETLADPYSESFFDLHFISSDSEQRDLEDYLDIGNDTDSLATARVPTLTDSCDLICPESSLHEENRGYSFQYHNTRQVNLDHEEQIGHQSSIPLKHHRYLKKQDILDQDLSKTSLEPSNGNDSQCSVVINENVHENSLAMSESHLSENRKFDFSFSRFPEAVDISIHHDHSYHLPFSSNESHYKLLLKDKTKSSEDEEFCNKEEKRAKKLKIPISIDDIINLSIEEFNEKLSKYKLTDEQLTLMRDIRRRGKNKVAAQNCRKRKMDQINSLQQDLETLQSKKMQLKSKQSHLLKKKHCIEDKYIQLYQIVCQYSNREPPVTPNSHLICPNPVTLPVIPDNREDADPNKGAKTKRKLKK